MDMSAVLKIAIEEMNTAISPSCPCWRVKWGGNFICCGYGKGSFKSLGLARRAFHGAYGSTLTSILLKVKGENSPDMTGWKLRDITRYNLRERNELIADLIDAGILEFVIT